MAKDLSKVISKINNVAKESFEKANVKKIIMVKDEQILDHPMNEEDLSYTEDIEEHIKSEGFRYPLVVTAMGVPENEKGKYYIVSGHRSRLAGRKLGRTEFPCIVEDYANEIEVYHALLTGNTRRNYDPLDLAGRYNKWDKYLDMINFKGNRAEQIGKCLGISAKQAEKYKAFNKIIPEFWELVRAGAAKDGLYILAPKPEDEQRRIYDFFLICNPQQEVYTVKMERDIINAWIIGARTYEEYCTYKEKREQSREKRTDKKEITEDIAVSEDKNNSEDAATAEEVINKQESILTQVSEGNIDRKIEGHNNNVTANEEFKDEENNKYKEERMTEEDFENSQKAVNIADDKDRMSGTMQEPTEKMSDSVSKFTEETQETEDYASSETDNDMLEVKAEVTELLKKLSYIQMKIKIDHSYESKGEASEVMEMLADLSMELMSNMETLRDKYGIYEEYDASSEKLHSYIKDLPFN